MTVRLPHRGWLFDLDGTVYLGEALIPGAAETLAALRADGRRVAFLSNKPLQTRADYAAKLTRLGVPAAAEDVINSSLVLARHLATLDPGAPVFAIGEDRSEEHTSELQSRVDLVCRLLLEKKKKKHKQPVTVSRSIGLVVTVITVNTVVWACIQRVARPLRSSDTVTTTARHKDCLNTRAQS